MSDPRFSVISKREEVTSGNYALIYDVLTRLEVPPEVGIINWP